MCHTLVPALLSTTGMQLRDAVAAIPDHSFARRVAIATGITTAIAIGGAIAVICSAPPREPLAPQTPRLAIASVHGGLPPPPAVTGPNFLLANHELRLYAFSAFPAWVASDPGRSCPRHLLELNFFDPMLHAVDPWGSPYQFVCGDSYGTAFAMRSAGPDGRFDTADDLSAAR